MADTETRRSATTDLSRVEVGITRLGVGEEGIQEDEVQISVPHISQENNWDCGLACAQMILRHCGKSFDDFDTVVKQSDFGESVWTIDLAILLRHYAVNNHFTTILLGVDKEYSKKSFYKSRFSTDQLRVDNLFKQAPTLGLSLEQCSVGMEEITSHMFHHRQPLIVLVDCNQLNCLWCTSRLTDHVVCNCFGNCLGRGGGYQGHFIVVSGFNRKTKVIFYKNPACRRQTLCCCSMQTLDRARMAHGTDQDIIFILPSTNSSLPNTSALPNTTPSSLPNCAPSPPLPSLQKIKLYHNRL